MDNINKIKLFLSYHFDENNEVKNKKDYDDCAEWFALRLNYYFKKQNYLKPYCYSDEKHDKSWLEKVPELILDKEKTDAFIFISGKTLGESQKKEGLLACSRKDLKKRIILLRGEVFPASLGLLKTDCDPIEVDKFNEENAFKCAREITRSLNLDWITDDGIPIGYPFDYEKKIIEEYSKEKLPHKYIELGCVKRWPKVVKNVGEIENPVPEPEIGLYRDWDRQNKKTKEKDSSGCRFGSIRISGK